MMRQTSEISQTQLAAQTQLIYENLLNGGIPPGLAAIASPIAARHFFCLRITPEENQILEKVVALLIDNIMLQVSQTPVGTAL
jgi:hypothetical protein